MALSGIHVACGYVSAPPGASLLGAIAWSQTMSSAGTTALAAPGPSATIPGAAASNLALEIRSSLDVYVAVAAAPDAASGPRLFVPANETRNIFCSPGDKLAWVAA